MRWRTRWAANTGRLRLVINPLTVLGILILALIGTCLGATFDWLYGRRLCFRGDGNTSGGVQALAALFGFELGAVAGLIAVVNRVTANEGDYELPVSMEYLFASLMPMFLMSSILHAPQHRRRRRARFHAFDRGTISFGRWCLSCSMVLVFVVTTACFMKKLPGQEVKHFYFSVEEVVEGTYESDFKRLGITKGDVRLDVTVKIESDELAKMRWPNPLTIDIELPRAIEDTWQVTAVDGFFMLDGEKKSTEPPPILRPLKSDHPSIRTVQWHGMSDERDHKLVIFIHQKRRTLGIPEVSKLIMDNGSDGMRISGRVSP